jgi:hypothetical protein
MRITRSLMAFIACICLAITQLGLVTPAQSTDDVIRINTELVVVDAQVINKKTGNMVTTLGRDDF